MKRQRLVVAALVGFGVLTAALITALAPAHAGATTELPQKFWGKWKSIDESVTPEATMKLNGTTITFESLPPSCKFTDVAVANRGRHGVRCQVALSRSSGRSRDQGGILSSQETRQGHPDDGKPREPNRDQHL